MASSRLPGKVLARIGKMTALEHIAQAFRGAGYPLIVAVPENSAGDAPLIQKAREIGLEVFEGHPESPLHRMTAAASHHGLEHVIRVTQDDIFQDPYLIKKQVKDYLSHEAEYSYITDIPRGADQEIMSVALLKQFSQVISGPVEFVSYLFRKPGVKTRQFRPPEEYRFEADLSIDYPEDLIVARIIHGMLNAPFGVLAINNLLKDHRNKYILDINQKPVVSVYTCSYNGQSYIERAMESVLLQKNMTKFEYVILDDGSTDETSRAVVEFLTAHPFDGACGAKLFRNDFSKGLAKSSNRILSRCRGKYVIRLDDDDQLEPEALSCMVGALNTARAANDMVGVCYSAYTEFKDGKANLKSSADNFHPGCAMFVRNFLNDIKFMDVPFGEGQELYSRFCKKFDVLRLDKALWRYYRHDDSKTGENPDGPGKSLAQALKGEKP